MPHTPDAGADNERSMMNIYVNVLWVIVYKSFTSYCRDKKNCFIVLGLVIQSYKYKH